MILDIETEQLVTYGQIALSISIVLLIGLILYIFIRRSLDALHNKGYLSESIRGGMQVFVRWAIMILVILIALQQVGVQITSVWAALSAFVVLIGVGLFAVWSVLSNALCSILLLVFRPFSIGDKIELIETSGGNGIYGKVVNLNMLYTFILEEKMEEDTNDEKPNTVVQIPNNIFFQKVIRRWQGRRTLSLEEIMFQDDEQSIKQNATL